MLSLKYNPSVPTNAENKSLNTTLASRSRQTHLDVLRGAAILAIVFFHALPQIEVGLGVELPKASWVNDALAPFRMPLLMFMSGLFLQRSLDKGVRKHTLGKIRYLLWPYLVWSIGTLAFLWSVSPWTSTSVSWSMVGQIFYGPSSAQWFLAYLFAYHCIALALSSQVRTAAIPVLLLIAHFVDSAPHFWFLMAFFFAGETFARLGTPNHRFPAWATAVSAITFIALAVASGSGIETKFVSLFAPAVLASFPALAIGAYLISKTALGTPFASVGRESLVYYVCHFLVINITFHALFRSGVTDNPWILLGSCCAAAVIAGYALTRLRRWTIFDALFVLPFGRHEPTS